MKRSILMLAATCLVGCAAHNSPQSSDSAQLTSGGKPVNTYCAINTSDKVDSTVTTVYKGQVIGFCCQDCIDEFKKDPDKYVAKMK